MRQKKFFSKSTIMILIICIISLLGIAFILFDSGSFDNRYDLSMLVTALEKDQISEVILFEHESGERIVRATLKQNSQRITAPASEELLFLLKQKDLKVVTLKEREGFHAFGIVVKYLFPATVLVFAFSLFVIIRRWYRFQIATLTDRSSGIMVRW